VSPVKTDSLTAILKKGGGKKKAKGREEKKGDKMKTPSWEVGLIIFG